MSNQFERKKIIPRYKIFAYLMLIIGIIILCKALWIATVEREYWTQVSSRLKKDSVEISPVRGNILSCDGRLMASSLPEFKLFMDFKAGGEKKDSLWKVKVDSICEGLHEIFPEKSASEFKAHLEEGHKKMSQNWPIWHKRVPYDIYSQVKKLPVFNLSKFKGGFHIVEFNARQRPFGSLARRTIGDMFGAKDTARCGLELSYDSILRGKKGLLKRRKVMNKYLSITEMEAIDGADIVTTIDVGMQDLAERAVIDELREINGNVGVAIVMEVQTGDIKAIVNMTKCSDGEYREVKNNAVADLLEPGSVFKTASLMVALDDGVVDTTYMVETGSGIWDMYGAKMRDHNWHKGGYQTISLPRTLEVSSNIGVSRIIDRFYGKNPEKFVEGINRLGLSANLNLPLVGATAPRIRMPKKNSRGQYINWSKTALPWMSIGYETQIPPISTLTFYNAIANNGKMVRPRFVQRIVKDGEVIQEFPTEVIKEKICKEKTLREMQTILEHVVSQGLGKKAGSPSFKVAGKTGTAQVSKGAGGYKTGMTNYLLSFAGYFPADAPRYSCIVCIQKSGLPASGGGMSGLVFHNIAEGIMAQNLKLDVADARDSMSIFMPDVKNGNILAADYVLSHLGITANKNWSGSYLDGNPIWGTAKREKNSVVLAKAPVYAKNVVPDVSGMGARDAVYMLETRGIKVRMTGRGKVHEQSLAPGHVIRKGETCVLKLD
ncbi:transpeptidase family protein [Prevotella sp. PCHR]|uniref:Transpeptidase family protein n=1 Tax=Xylanibacter caecicola TaxID=2736294 RepID=A0ABX2AXT4_9BACT|nr:penicillin-binding transpeptidase domain-containing protein [Xylanibacter caecicola]NPE24061.1 transpeptidase family protein [Xylanibacter caecicola]